MVNHQRAFFWSRTPGAGVECVGPGPGPEGEVRAVPDPREGQARSRGEEVRGRREGREGSVQVQLIKV